MFNVEDKKVHQAPGGWIPVRVGEPPKDGEEDMRIACMSLGFLLKDRGDSVVWRGPKKTAMVRQFMTDVLWEGIDYLLIDTPPGMCTDFYFFSFISPLARANCGMIGTSDEHISLAEQLRSVSPDGAVVVTTPQAVATADVRKELNFCKKVGLNILGVIENMSGFVCPHCSECTNVFSSGGGLVMAEQFGVEFLGKVPIDPSFNMMIENQGSWAQEGEGEGIVGLVERYGESRLYEVFKGIMERLVVKVNQSEIN